jgi:hypothetical protein
MSTEKKNEKWKTPKNRGGAEKISKIIFDMQRKNKNRFVTARLRV